MVKAKTYVENFGKYSVKKVKLFMGMDTQGLNCDLYDGTKKIATCIDDGGGGEMLLRFINPSERALFEGHLRTLPKIRMSCGGTSVLENMLLEVDAAIFVDELTNRHMLEKDIAKMKKQCLVKTMFRTKEHKEGAYRVWPHPYTTALAEHIRAKYGADTEIFNEVIAKGGIPSVLKRRE